MKNLAISFVFILLFSIASIAQSQCVQNAKVIKPAISDKARKVYSQKLYEAERKFKNSPEDADAIIWFGRRNAYLGNYKEAINIYTDGIANHPRDARMYRHRGHRLITLRCFNDAIKDFKKAAKLIKGKPLEIEPDGLPNARNIPTSTLQSNIWYHLGLAYYLKRRYKDALKSYDECVKVSQNPDMFVATANWRYLTLKRMGKDKQAAKFLRRVKEGYDIIENHSYYKLLKLYQRKITAADIEKESGSDSNSLNNVSIGYGLGNWYRFNGENGKALKIFQKLTSGDQWASFGFIAAEADLKGF